MKTSGKITLWISRVLVWLVIALLIALTFTIPKITDYYIEHLAHIANAASLRTPTIVFIYASLVPAFIAIIALAAMLRNISKDNIFIRLNVDLLRAIHLACFAEAIIFFVFGFWYNLAFILSFAALFIGIMLRVVMNLMAHATDIKDENDYTI